MYIKRQTVPAHIDFEVLTVLDSELQSETEDGHTFLQPIN